MNSTCDRDDSIICQLPAGTQRATSPPLRPFLARVSEDDQGWAPRKKGHKVVSLLLHRSSAYYTPICITLLLEFCLFVLVFIAFSFYVPYKRVLSVNSNYPPFLSLNQGFGYRTCFSLPSKQLWLWCWPRFTVLLEQYVALCLGFLGMVYECTHSSVIVYSLKSACQFAINVKRQLIKLSETICSVKFHIRLG